MILAGLYPLVVLHSWFVAPHLEHLGPAPAMLVGTASTVALLGWPVLPALRRAMGWWVGSSASDERTRTAGVVIVVSAMTAMAPLLALLGPRAN